MKRVSIFGLGYVGTVSSACLAKLGHRVIGVDINKDKVGMINRGESPIVEPGLARLLSGTASRKGLTATTDAVEAVRSTTISMICVGTPSAPNGDMEYGHLFNVCRQIGRALKEVRRYHLVVIRSTCMPGTSARATSLIEKASGKKAGKGFGLAVNPEFLREGSAITDFNRPPYTVVGVSSRKDEKMLRDAYAGIKAEFIVTDPGVAEMIKYANNSFHAAKVTFANEIGSLCKRVGVDSHKVMDIFCRDTKLNVSKAYLRPGFAFGGSCLPKDLRALSYLARSRDLDIPLLNATLLSNQRQIEELVGRLSRRKGVRIGILGLAFKSGTDDLRESPMVRVVEALIGKGFRIAVFDPNVSMARLMGANKAYIENEIPHLSRLLKGDLGEIIDESDVLVVGSKEGLTPGSLKKMRKGQVVIDLVRGIPETVQRKVRYEGLYW